MRHRGGEEQCMSVYTAISFEKQVIAESSEQYKRQQYRRNVCLFIQEHKVNAECKEYKHCHHIEVKVQFKELSCTAIINSLAKTLLYINIVSFNLAYPNAFV